MADPDRTPNEDRSVRFLLLKILEAVGGGVTPPSPFFSSGDITLTANIADTALSFGFIANHIQLIVSEITAPSDVSISLDGGTTSHGPYFLGDVTTMDGILASDLNLAGSGTNVRVFAWKG